VRASAEHQDVKTIPRKLSGRLVDAADQGAGRIEELFARRFQAAAFGVADPMRGDQNCVGRGQESLFLRAGGETAPT
jgi:hypothetical protein